MAEVRILHPHELALLDTVAPDVFDNDIDPGWAAEFLADARHHLAVAVDAGRVVGMASGVHYVHPDKPPELWINEVGVASTHQRQGIGTRLVSALLEHARVIGCREAWVLTDADNESAQRMYRAAGGRPEAKQPVMFTFQLREKTPV
jgi:ribosomal protein S18 acetylase RimI-like enzyme